MARAAIRIPRPLYTSTAHRLDILIFEDSDQQTRKNISVATVTLLVKDTGATLRTYAATIEDTGADDDDRGRAYVTLSASYHTVAGDADAQLLEDGIPIQDYVMVFRLKLS